MFEPNNPRLRDQIRDARWSVPTAFRPAIDGVLLWILAGAAGFGGTYAVLWLLEQVWRGPSGP